MFLFENFKFVGWNCEYRSIWKRVWPKPHRHETITVVIIITIVITVIISIVITCHSVTVTTFIIAAIINITTTIIRVVAGRKSAIGIKPKSQS